jgi:hypothetical protein
MLWNTKYAYALLHKPITGTVLEYIVFLSEEYCYLVRGGYFKDLRHHVAVNDKLF